MNLFLILVGCEPLLIINYVFILLSHKPSNAQACEQLYTNVQHMYHITKSHDALFAAHDIISTKSSRDTAHL